MVIRKFPDNWKVLILDSYPASKAYGKYICNELIENLIYGIGVWRRVICCSHNSEETGQEILT